MLSVWKNHLSEYDHSKVLVVIGGCVTSTLIVWRVHKWTKDRAYDQECLRIRQDRDLKITKLDEKLTSLGLNQKQVDKITELPLKELTDCLKTGKLTAKDTLHAYQWKALRAHRLTNCLTNVFEDAEQLAEKLDAKPVKEGLLFGVPVSIKDNLPTKGHVNTRGCVIFGRDIPEDDALIVKALKEQGAIPFVKTNIPQLMMGVESGNAIYGTTCHPMDATRTPCGSSGGEGALISYGGSILGIGSDIGGSIRMPSNYCGIYGLKPSSDRVSKRGLVPYGQTITRSCWGPMSTDIHGLVLTMQALTSQSTYNNDKSIPPLPFNMEIFEQKGPLTIGYYINDGVQTATPDVARAVTKAKLFLEKRGHKLVKWVPPEPFFSLDAFLRSLSGDRGCLLRGFLGSTERIHISLKHVTDAFSMHDFIRFPLLFLIWLSGDRTAITGLSACRGVPSVSALFQLTTKVKLYIQRFEEAWNNSGLDVVICPVNAHPALKLGFSAKVPVNTFYTGLYNLLDYACGVVPVTTVEAADVDALSGFPQQSKLQRYLVKDLQDSQGLPVCVQCVAPTWREELCLRLMKELDECVKNELLD